jgi:hypothetical protein
MAHKPKIIKCDGILCSRSEHPSTVKEHTIKFQKWLVLQSKVDKTKRLCICPDCQRMIDNA